MYEHGTKNLGGQGEYERQGVLQSELAHVEESWDTVVFEAGSE